MPSQPRTAESCHQYIRKLPGLSRFLLPSLFPDLRRAAGGGPVIIVNASEYSCDALRDPIHIPLQITQKGVRDLSTELHTLTVRATRDDVTRVLGFVFRKLWDQIVSIACRRPIHLNHASGGVPPPSSLCCPLHAAGPYSKDQQNLAHLYVSSHTSTLTALIRARRRDPSGSATEQKRFIAIGSSQSCWREQTLFP